MGDVTFNLNHSTITNNTADSDSDGGDGGGIYTKQGMFASAVTVTLKNSIVAGNTDNTTAANNDCYRDSGTLTSQFYNIIGNNDGCSVTAGTGDNFGSTASPVDAKLLGLLDNGGPTETHALNTGSPAIEQIPDGTNGCDGKANGSTSVDQRGGARAQGTNKGDDKCDIGAYESGSTQTPTAISLQSFAAQAGSGMSFPGPVALAAVFVVGLLAVILHLRSAQAIRAKGGHRES